MESRHRHVDAGRPHHLVLRGNNRRKLFSYQSDYALFIHLLADATDKVTSEIQVHAVCLLSNHVHLLVTPATSNVLAKWVRLFAQRYARLRNLRRSGSGKLFEQRFHSTPIVTNEHMAIVTAYIDLNAHMAGIECGYYDIYPWTTYPLHAGMQNKSKIPTKLWKPSFWFLQLGSNDNSRQAAYRQFAMSYARRAGELQHIKHIEQAKLHSLAKTLRSKRFERPDGTRAT